MPTRGPPAPPPVPPGPPPWPARVWRASSNFLVGSSLSSVFSFQNPASVFLGSTSGFFFTGFAGGAGGGGNGCDGGKGPGGAWAKIGSEVRSPAAQRSATQAIVRIPEKRMFCVTSGTSPRNASRIDGKTFTWSCFWERATGSILSCLGSAYGNGIDH